MLDAIKNLSVDSEKRLLAIEKAKSIKIAGICLLLLPTDKARTSFIKPYEYHFVSNTPYCARF